MIDWEALRESIDALIREMDRANYYYNNSAPSDGNHAMAQAYTEAGKLRDVITAQETLELERFSSMFGRQQFGPQS